MATITELPDMVRSSLRPVQESLAAGDGAPGRALGLAAGCRITAGIIESAQGMTNLLLQLGVEGGTLAGVFRSLLAAADESLAVCEKARLELAGLDAPAMLTGMIAESVNRILKAKEHFVESLAWMEDAMRQPPTIPAGWKRGEGKLLTFEEAMRELQAGE